MRALLCVCEERKRFANFKDVNFPSTKPTLNHAFILWTKLLNLMHGNYKSLFGRHGDYIVRYEITHIWWTRVTLWILNQPLVFFHSPFSKIMKNIRNCGLRTSFNFFFFEFFHLLGISVRHNKKNFKQNEPFYDEYKWTVCYCCPWLKNVNLINHKKSLQ